MNLGDMKNIDTDQSTNPADDEEPSMRKRIIVILTAILLFIAGMLLAPPSVTPDSYSITINYGNQQFNFQLNISETVSTPSNLILVQSDSYNLSYYAVQPYAVGQVIKFDLVVPDDPVDSSEIYGRIKSANLNYSFLAEKISSDTYRYSFKILTNTGIALGLLFAIAFLWLTEVIPLAASSLLIPVILVLFKVQDATTALEPFAEPIIFLFLAGFLMAEAMHRTKLDQAISYRLFSLIPPDGKILLIALMSLSAFFSMFMSNTAAVAILVPLSLQLLKGADLGDAKYRKTTVLGIAYAATVGGIGSLIGTPPNIIATELLREFNPDYEITFVQWFLFGLPVVILMVPIIFIYLWFRFKPEVSHQVIRHAQLETRRFIKEELPFTLDQKIISAIFLLTFGLWLTSSFHGISAGIIALMAAVLLFFVGQLQQSDLNVINWNALLTFGGGLSLGALIIQTGLADYIGSRAVIIADFPLIIILFILSLIGLILTAFASNTASAVILVPIVLPLSYILGISPVILAVLVAIASSVDFAIVIGTPPTMMAYSTGLFNTQEIFRIGIVLDFVGLIVITLLSWSLFGFVAGII